MSVDNLLNFNGVNGTQVFTDGGDAPLVFSPSTVDPVLDTTEKKFGTASVIMNGTGELESTTLITLPDSFTLECWFKIATADIGRYQFIVGWRKGAAEYGINVSANSKTINMWHNNFTMIFGTLTHNIDEWNHVALVAINKRVSLYLNGSLSGNSFNIDDGSDIQTDVNLLVSGVGVSSGILEFIGNIDDFRYSPNEAIYNNQSFRTPVIAELTTTVVAPPVLPSDHYLTHDDLLQTIRVRAAYDPDGEFIKGVGSGSGGGVEPPATSTNIITGNVKKLGLPFGASVVAVSIGLDPAVLGSTTSDGGTGDYSIDVYPEVDEVLLYVAPEYGVSFTPDFNIGIGQVMHPTVPNKNVYVALNSGQIASIEPNWPDSGQIVSNEVTFDTVPLYRPLMNGYIKPVITPI